MERNIKRQKNVAAIARRVEPDQPGIRTPDLLYRYRCRYRVENISNNQIPTVFFLVGYDSKELSLYWLDTSSNMHLFLDEKSVRNMPKFQMHNFLLHKYDIPWRELHTHPGKFKLV